MTFGSYIREKRLTAGYGLRETAKQITLCPAHLSDIENEKRNPPGKEILEHMAGLYGLNKEETDTMYDLAGEKRNGAPPDLVDYIMENKGARDVLRIARDKKMGDKEWNKLKAAALRIDDIEEG